MSGAESFEIWLVWSDRRVVVPAGVSALSILKDAGVPLEPGCMVGSCGECVTQYVDGDVVHKDSCLSAGDRKRLFCPCVSRARGTLAVPL